MQRSSQVSIEANISLRANNRVVETEKISQTAIQLLNPKIAPTPVVSIADHRITRTQHHIPTREETTIRMIEGKDIYPLISLQYQLARGGGNKRLFYTVPHLHCIGSL